MQSPKKKKQSRFPYRTATLLGFALILLLSLSAINLRPDLSGLSAGLLSGPQLGNYHAVANKLRDAAAKKNGTLRVKETRGTVENLERLHAERDDCDSEFAMVQDGVPGPKDSELELVARFPKSESVFILGRNAGLLSQFSDLQGMRIGVGPRGSGTDHLSRAIFEHEDFSSLRLDLQNHSIAEQMSMVGKGELDLAVLVMDEDAPMIREAWKSGLQIASFEHIDVIARRHSYLRHGRIAAAQFDPIAVIPKEDKRVLRVDTLLLGNGCADRTEIVGLLGLLQHEIPGFLQHNRESSGSHYFPSSSVAQEYFLRGEPEWADRHLPWLVDIMPLGNWVYLVMAVSILFNIMTSVHKFRMWRIDANRDRATEVLRDLLGEERTPEEIAELAPLPEHASKDAIAKMNAAIADLDELRVRCRKHENSFLVPMGQELAYRYEEEQMENLLQAIRQFRARALALAEELPEEQPKKAERESAVEVDNEQPRDASEKEDRA